MGITTSRTILFLGSNPSKSSSSTLPFWGDSKSRRILDLWLSEITLDSCDSIIFANVTDRPTENNRALKMSEIRYSLLELQLKILEAGPTKIVSLGKAASTALTLLRVEHFAMPHPSGRNRQLNNKLFINLKLEQLRLYLSDQGEGVNDVV